MSDLRASIILNMTGNLGNQSRKFGRDLHNMGERGSRAINTMNRGLQTFGRGINSLGTRYSGFLLGAGGVGVIKMIGNMEARLTQLGIDAGVSADEVERLNKEIFRVSKSPHIRVDPSELTAAVEEIASKTGDLDFVRSNLESIAVAISATGAQGSAIGAIAAEFQKMGLSKDDIKEAFDTLAVQGKEGAFTLKKLADLGPRAFSAYTKTGRTGLSAVREMGAVLQVIMRAAGSEEGAVTSFENLIKALTDSSKAKGFKKLGIKIWDEESLKKGEYVLRPITNLMAEIVEATKGRTSILNKLLGDTEAANAFNSLVSEYLKDKKISSLQHFNDVVADGSLLLKDSARNAGTFNAAMRYLNTTFKEFADNELTEPIHDLADFINSIEPGKVQEWFKIAKYLGIIGAVATFPKVSAGAVGAYGGSKLNQLMGDAAQKMTDGKYKGAGWAGEMYYDYRHMDPGELANAPMPPIMRAALLIEQFLNRKTEPAEVRIGIQDNRVSVTKMKPGSNVELEIDTGPIMRGIK
jgi:hypothetical protein